MRVLWVDFSTDRVEWELIRFLWRSGIEGFVFAQPGSQIARSCPTEGIPCLEHRFPGRLDPRGARAIRERLTAERYDLIHCVTGRGLAAALHATRFMPSPRPKILAYRGAISGEPWWSPLTRLTYLNRRVDAISCVCEAVRRHLRASGVPESKLFTIHKGHDPAWYQPAPRGSLERCGVPSDAVRIVFCGTIRPIKGVDVLLRAFDGITDPRVHLVLIGELRDRHVARWRGRNPRMHFLGPRPDAAALAGSCDIVVMPSVKREGLPKALLEAMAQGVAPVVTDVGGLPEAVVNGESGLVVRAGDPEALRAALWRLATDEPLRRQMGMHARQRVDGPLNFRHTFEKTLAIYRWLEREGRSESPRAKP